MALNPYNRHLVPYPLFGLDLDPFGSIFDDPTQDSMWMPVIPNLPRASDMNVLTTSPGYEISHTDDGKTYHISMDIPGVQAGDIKVNVEQGGKVLHITGGRKHTETSKDGKTTTKTVSHFEKRFTIGNTVDADKMTANLENGVLTLTAPVKPEKAPVVRTIPITTNAAIEESKEEKKIEA